MRGFQKTRREGGGVAPPAATENQWRVSHLNGGNDSTGIRDDFGLGRVDARLGTLPYPQPDFENATASSSNPYLTGCAPLMPGLQTDFASFETLGDVDFSAFDVVFGDQEWQFADPMMDFDMPG